MPLIIIGPWEIALILIIIFIAVEAGKLSHVSQAISNVLRTFRKEQPGETPEGEAAEESGFVKTARRESAETQTLPRRYSVRQSRGSAFQGDELWN